MGSDLKYFTLFHLDSKPKVFHDEFHEIIVKAKRRLKLGGEGGWRWRTKVEAGEGQ